MPTAPKTKIVASLDKPYDRDGIRITNPCRYCAESVPWLKG